VVRLEKYGWSIKAAVKLMTVANSRPTSS